MLRSGLMFLGAGVGYLVTILIILAGLPFWVVALCTRALQQWIEPRTVPWNELIQFDPVVGWKLKPSIRQFSRAPGADVFYVETDAEGWCGPASLDESDLVVFGDSYAFGYAANHPFFRLSPAGLRIKAVAAQGYSMVQELLLMMQLAPRLRGKLVVWFIYVGNDLIENLSPSMQGYRAPFVLQCGDRGGWEIFTKHLQAAKWNVQPPGYDRGKRIYPVFGRNHASDRVYNACEFLLSRGQEVCQENKAHLVVLTIPWSIQFDPLPWLGVDDKKLDPDLPDKKIGEICQKFDLECLMGRQIFSKRHYISYEGHLNDSGHRQLAMALRDLHKRHRSTLTLPS